MALSSAGQIDVDSDTSSLLSLTRSLEERLVRIEGTRSISTLEETFQTYAPPPAWSYSEYYALWSTVAHFGRKQQNELGYEPERGLIDRAIHAAGCNARALDVGAQAGKAAWISSIAQANPSLEAIGFVLNPPQEVYLPPNASLEVGGVSDGLPFPDDFFTVVRAVSACLWVPDMPFFISELARVLAPGGILLMDEDQTPTMIISPGCDKSPLLDLCLERDELYEQGMAFAQPGYADPGRLVLQKSLPELVRGTGVFNRVEGLFGTVQLTGSPHPEIRALARRYIDLMWQFKRGQLAHLSHADVAEMERLDASLLAQLPDGLAEDFLAVFAVKKLK